MGDYNAERPCIDCGATGRVSVDTVIDDEEARRLRDALSKETGDTSAAELAAMRDAFGVDGSKPLADEVRAVGKRLADIFLEVRVPEAVAEVEQRIATWLAEENERLDGLWSVNDARRRIVNAEARRV